MSLDVCTYKHRYIPSSMIIVVNDILDEESLIKDDLLLRGKIPPLDGDMYLRSRVSRDGRDGRGDRSRPTNPNL